MRIISFDNQIMQSNCYIIVDDEARSCIVVDPASEKSLNEISFIKTANLVLDYIILTHEHTDHTWGVNSLLDTFPCAKVLCTIECKKELPKASQAYFRFYLDDSTYEYYVRRVDVTTEDINWELYWNQKKITFIYTPGHSVASMCFSIENNLFSGDTIMLFKKMYVNKRSGGAVDVWKHSVKKVISMYDGNTMVFPGHGKTFYLKEFCYE